MAKKAQTKPGAADEKGQNAAVEPEKAEAAGAPGEGEAKAQENTAEADAAVQKELCETKDMLLRLKAEYANFRKRSEKEKADTFAFATAAAVKELLPVVDNLERALSNESEDFDALKKGVQMTFDGVMAGFEKLGVQVFAEPGDIFDPELHNAVMHIESEEHKAGEIVEVYQKGVRLGDKVIRPAMVKTAN